MFLNVHTVVTTIQWLDFIRSIGLYKLQNKRGIKWKVSRQTSHTHTRRKRLQKDHVKLQVISGVAGAAHIAGGVDPLKLLFSDSFRPHGL